MLGLDGEWLLVEGVDYNGQITTVYKFRVADWHTYFVGSDEWGFSVWAHNACVYQSVENGNVVYIGIADTGTLPSLANRLRAAAARNPGAITSVIPGTTGITRLEAKQIEQELIN